MPRSRKRKNKLLCYPMIGPVREQFATLTGILRAIQADDSASKDTVRWLRTKFDLSQSFASKVCSVLLLGTGLVKRKGKRYCLGVIGVQFARSPDNHAFYRLLCENFFGVDLVLSVLKDVQPASLNAIQQRWSEEMRKKQTAVASWRAKHQSSQLRFRLDWLRSLGLVDMVSGRYVLSQQGLRELRAVLQDAANSEEERTAISHSDLEDKLTLIGAFFQFQVQKRASVNRILPPANRPLQDDRQVDCLWVRFVHFGGRLQYPFEVHLSGNMADAIERLEMVANVVQKAVVVTDEQQQKVMLDRLRVKRSPLLDKLVFLTPDDVDKVVEAASVMKSFTDQLFSE